jgi:hypothetical protein
MDNYEIDKELIERNWAVDTNKKFEMEESLKHLFLWYRKISGTYKNKVVASGNSILELRVDVDGRRPQHKLSGDFYTEFKFQLFNIGIALAPSARVYTFRIYRNSFIVENVTHTSNDGVAILTGQLSYYDDPSITDETIEVRIPRVSFFSKAPGATIKIFKSGILKNFYCSPKISEYFRIVTLEIDRYQGTSYPPDANMNLTPSPSNLPTGTISTEQVFKNAGIDMNVIEDDVLNDADSGDVGTNWDEVELHQLMEDNFDRFSNTLQWNVYGVVVPRFGDPHYNSGYYGTMFDWGGWQAGDTYFRQGAAIAEDATRGRTSGTLYDNANKKDRLVLQTFCHEIGHAFNLPHTFDRTTNNDTASESFMNYPWNFTGGTGGESQFWSHFRWEFDDDELIWMRHGNRRDVIFGGNDWIGNNLSIYTEPEGELANAPLSLEIRGRDVHRYAEPVRLELKLKNISSESISVIDRLQPEDQLIALYIKRPNGEHTRYVSPVRRLKAPGDIVNLAPGKAIYESIMLSYGAKGPQFKEPGEYSIRAYYGGEINGFIKSPSFRLRISSPHSNETDQLAHLMFDHRAAKFLYYNGGYRYPEIIKDLEKASVKYARSHPEVVRNIQAALGINYSRDYKRILEKRGKRVVILTKPDNKKAIKYMSESIKKLPGKKYTALDNITYNIVASRLIDCMDRTGNRRMAKQQIKDSINYFKDNSVINSVIMDYNKRLQKMRKGSRSK